MKRNTRWGLVLVLLLGVFSSTLLLDACTAPPILEAVLGPPVKPVPVTYQPRRPAYKPWKEFTMAYKEEAPKKTDWSSRLKLLPRDATDNIDWVKAFNQKLIQPKPGLDNKTEDQDPMDLIVELTPKDQPDMKATFSHLPHTQVLTCDNCHPAIFQQEAGADPITMDKIFAGEYCGRCHGPVAFDPASACPRCHLGMQG